jgi:hypothetical protein
MTVLVLLVDPYAMLQTGSAGDCLAATNFSSLRYEGWNFTLIVPSSVLNVLLLRQVIAF